MHCTGQAAEEEMNIASKEEPLTIYNDEEWFLRQTLDVKMECSKYVYLYFNLENVGGICCTSILLSSLFPGFYGA